MKKKKVKEGKKEEEREKDNTRTRAAGEEGEELVIYAIQFNSINLYYLYREINL